MISPSMPDRLARALFSGLPTMMSSAFGACGPASKATLGPNAGGVVVPADASPGGDSPVGVLSAGDLRVAGDPAFRGSAECWRFS